VGCDLIEILDELPHLLCGVEMTVHLEHKAELDGHMVCGLGMLAHVRDHRAQGAIEVSRVHVLESSPLTPAQVLFSCGQSHQSSLEPLGGPVVTFHVHIVVPVVVDDAQTRLGHSAEHAVVLGDPADARVFIAEHANSEKCLSLKLLDVVFPVSNALLRTTAEHHGHCLLPLVGFNHQTLVAQSARGDNKRTCIMYTIKQVMSQ